MQVPGPVLLQQLNNNPAQVVRPGQWSVGQLLQAVVTGSGSSSGLPAHTAALQIGTQQILAYTPSSLQPGEQLNLRVVRAGQQPVLQVVSSLGPQSQLALDATRQALPRSGPMQPLLNNLFTVAARSEAFGGHLPAGSITLVKSILANLPELSGIRDGAALQRAIAGSGIFLEAKLAALVKRPVAHALGADLKAGLLKLASQTSSAFSAPGTSSPPNTGQPQASSRSAGQPQATSSNSAGQSQTTPTRGAVLSQAASAQSVVLAQATSPHIAGLLQTTSTRFTGQPQTTPSQSSGQPLATSPQSAGQPQATSSQSAGQPQTTSSQSAGQAQAQASTTLPQPLSAIVLAGLRPGEEPAMVLNRQSEAGLARIQLDQLATVTHENPRGALWALDIPIRDGNQGFIARLRIEQNQHQATPDTVQGSVWSVTLEFDMPELGPIQARLSMAGDNIDTRLWAERAGTMELMQNFTEVLRQRLADAGFAEASVTVFPGKAPVSGTPGQVSDLINLKA